MNNWDSREIVQWPVNWPKELKEDPFNARKEVIHQEINRKAKKTGSPRQEKLGWRQFPCVYSCLPWGRKGHITKAVLWGFTWVSKLQASLLSARWDIGSLFLSGLKNSNS